MEKIKKLENFIVGGSEIVTLQEKLNELINKFNEFEDDMENDKIALHLSKDGKFQVVKKIK